VPERKTYMPNSTDTRPIIKSLCICVVGSVLLVLGGCSRQNQAVDLYVDAVMFKEFDQNERAVEKLNEAVKLNKNFSLAYSLLGEIYQEIKDYEKSAAAYETATELNPWSFKDYFNLGRVYQIMQKFAQAVKAYVRACELKPDHIQAHINAAQSFYHIEDYNSALAYGHAAEQIDPNVAEVQKVLGDVYESQSDYDQAIRSYKRALEIDSNDPDVMISLAVVYLRTSRNEPAKELLTSVLQSCYLRLEQVDESIQSYDRALQIDDKNWEAHRGLGVAYMLKALDNEDEVLKARAVEQWQLSLDIRPDQPRREKLLRLISKYSEQRK
jgi:tetratricopeptide (TPR) repeat protein